MFPFHLPTAVGNMVHKTVLLPCLFLGTYNGHYHGFGCEGKIHLISKKTPETVINKDCDYFWIRLLPYCPPDQANLHVIAVSSDILLI